MSAPSSGQTNRSQQHPSPSLPHEILLQIQSYLTAAPEWHPAPGSPSTTTKAYDAQHTLWAFSLVGRSFYASSVRALYAHPRLSSKNFAAFVATICPSINAHVRQTDLAGMVRVLDLSALVYAGTKSLVARIMNRLRAGLEVLVAPQTSFAYVSALCLVWSSCRVSPLGAQFLPGLICKCPRGSLADVLVKRELPRGSQ